MGLREIKAKPRLINKLDRTNQCYEYLRKQQAELITIYPYITYMCNLLVILLFIDHCEPLTLQVIMDNIGIYLSASVSVTS